MSSVKIMEGIMHTEGRIPVDREVVTILDLKMSSSPILSSHKDRGSKRKQMLVCRVQNISKRSSRTGHICLEAFDLTGSLPCIIKAPDVSLLNGVWYISSWALNGFARGRQELLPMNLPLSEYERYFDDRSRVQKYLQVDSTGPRMDVCWTRDGAPDLSVDVKRKLLLHEAITIDDLNSMHQTSEILQSTVSLKFKLVAASPLIPSFSEPASSKFAGHVFLLVSSMTASVADAERWQTMTVEIQGSLANRWYPFLMVDSCYVITHLRFVKKCINGQIVRMLTPGTSNISKNMDKPDRKKRRSEQPQLFRCKEDELSGITSVVDDENIRCERQSVLSDTVFECVTKHPSGALSRRQTRDWTTWFKAPVSYHGKITKRIQQDLFELDGPKCNMKLLVSNAGESCMNGGVALVQGAEIIARNVHVVFDSTGAAIGVGTCAFSQIEILSFSREPVLGQVLRRAKSPISRLYRRYSLNLRESMWANKTLSHLMHAFRSCLRELRLHPTTDESPPALLEKLFLYFSQRGTVSGDESVVRSDHDYKENSMWERSIKSRNVFTEFLFHDECCVQNLDYGLGVDSKQTCVMPPFPLPRALPVSHLLDARLSSFENIIERHTFPNDFFQLRTISSSRMFKKQPSYLLVCIDCCSKTGHLIAVDDSGSIPIVFSGGNDAAADIFHALVLPDESGMSRLIMLRLFTMVEEQYGTAPPRRYLLAEKKHLLSDFNFQYMYKKPVVVESDGEDVLHVRILNSTGALRFTENPTKCLTCAFDVEVLESRGSREKGANVTLCCGALSQDEPTGSLSKSMSRWRQGIPLATAFVQPGLCYEVITKDYRHSGCDRNKIFLSRFASIRKLPSSSACESSIRVLKSIKAWLQWYGSDEKNPTGQRHIKVPFLLAEIVSVSTSETRKSMRVNEFSSLLGIGPIRQKLKLRARDTNSMDEADIFLECSDIVLPFGIIPGAVVEFQNIYFAISKGGVGYFAETSTTDLRVLAVPVNCFAANKSIRFNWESSSAERPLLLSSFIRVPQAIALSAVCARIIRLYFVRLSSRHNGFSWEASAAIEDGSLTARVHFDNRQAIALLGLDPNKESEMEALCRSHSKMLEYNRNHGVMADDEHTLSGKFQHAILAAFKPRQTILFCRPLRVSSTSSVTQKVNLVNIRINGELVESVRTPELCLKCCGLEEIEYESAAYKLLTP